MAHRSRASHRGALSNEGDLIMGKPRWMWVEDACRAIIASTMPDGRWVIVRQGFTKFEFWARTAFKNLSPFTFTSRELRDIFEGVEKYSARHDQRLHRAFARMYDKRHQWDRTKPIETEKTLDDVIQVESVRDGFLKRVQ